MKKFLLLTFLVTLLSQTKAQTGITVAGLDSGSAANQLAYPGGIYVDHSGYLYVADQNNNRIQKFPPGSDSTTNGVTVAGGNGLGSAANQFNDPSNVYVDGSGNIYVADCYNHRIQKFPAGSTSTTNGVTIAGGNGMGTAANQLHSPNWVCLDSSGNIYVADFGNNRIQKFPSGSTSSTNGVTVAGGNDSGYAANQFNGPADVYVDHAGNIYVADLYNNRVQKFPPGSDSATNGVTVAGGNGVGTAANQFDWAFGIDFDTSGNLYVVDVGNDRVLQFPPGSTSSTDGAVVAGGNGAGSASDQFNNPNCVFVTESGSYYVSDVLNERIQKFSPYVPTYPITISPPLTGPICAGTTFNLPFSVSGQFFSDNNIFTAELSDASGSFSNPVSIGTLYDPPPYYISCTIPTSTVYGTGYRVRIVGSAPMYGSGIGGDNGVGLTIYPVPQPPTLTLAGPGLGSDSLVVTGEGSASQITWYNGGTFANTTIPYQSTIVAGGNGAGDFPTFLTNPTGVYVDGYNNIYVADEGNNRIQKFPSGSTSSTPGVTVANTLNGPSDVFLDGNGNIFVSDAVSNCIEEFPAGSPAGTAGTIVAGNPNGTSILNEPSGLFVDGNDGVYVADFLNERVVYFPSGAAGSGVTLGSVNAPTGVYLDAYGNVYASVSGTFPGYGCVMEFLPGNNTPIIVGGNNGTGTTQTQLAGASSVCIDGNGNIYVSGCNRIEEFPAGGSYASSAVTVAVNAVCYTGIFLDGNGNTYVANADMNRIERWSPCPLRTAYTPTSIGSYTATYVTSNGCVSQPSNAVPVNQTNGINTIEDHTAISLYPNPNSGSFILQSSGSIGREYTVYDMIGRAIAQGTISTDKQNIDLKGIAMGSYTLEVPGSKAVRFVIEN